MPTSPAPKGLRLYLPLLITSVIVLVVDQVSKAWANGDWGFAGLERCATLKPRPTVGFCLAFNEGMAFSMGWGAGALIAPIAIGIVIVMLVFASKMSFAQRLMMGAIAGGAVGNLIDRAVRVAASGEKPDKFMGGAVVDFFYSSFFATFNVADAAIVVGGILLAITVYRMPDPDEAPSEAGVAAAPTTPETVTADAEPKESSTDS